MRAGSLLLKGDRGLDAVTWLSLPGRSCHLTNFSFFPGVCAGETCGAQRDALSAASAHSPRLQTNPAAKLKQPSKPRAAFPRHEDLGTIPGPPFQGPRVVLGCSCGAGGTSCPCWHWDQLVLRVREPRPAGSCPGEPGGCQEDACSLG